MSLPGPGVKLCGHVACHAELRCVQGEKLVVLHFGGGSGSTGSKLEVSVSDLNGQPDPRISECTTRWVTSRPEQPFCNQKASDRRIYNQASEQGEDTASFLET